MRLILVLTILVPWPTPANASAACSSVPNMTPPQAGDLVVNEIQPWPESPLPEYIEVLNRTARTLRLEELGIADDRLFTTGKAAIRRVPLPAGGYVLPPGEYLVLAESAVRFGAVYPDVPAIEVPGWPVLNNGGDSVVLLAGEILMDAVTYLGSWRKGASALERVDPLASSEAPTNWAACSDPTGGTPGRRNSAYAPDTSPPVVLFAEQESATDLRIQFNEPVRPPGLPSTSFSTEPAVSCLQGGPTSDPAQLRYRCQSLKEVVRVHLIGLEDHVGNQMVDTTVSLARIPDSGELILNEIHYDPLADDYDGIPNQPEYVEILNVSSKLMAVRTCSLVDLPDERGASTVVPVSMGYAALGPDDLGVLVADPTSMEPGVSPALDAAYPERRTMEKSFTWVASRSSLGLNNAGEPIRLVCNGLVVDSVNYMPGWHNPGLVETKGRSLERRTAAGPSNVGWNWSTSTAMSGGTPGAPNSIRTNSVGDPGTGRGPVRAVLFTPDGDGEDDVAALPAPFGDDGLLLRALVFDVAGRPVRRLESGRFAGSGSLLLWDGRDDAGRELSTGPYIVWIEGVDGRSGRVHTSRSVVVLSRRGGR